MKQCPNCKRELPDQAVRCPKCNCDLATGKVAPKKWYQKAWVYVVAGVFVLGLIGIIGENVNQPTDMTSGDGSIADSSTATSSETSSPSSDAVDAFGALWEDDSSTVPESKPESRAASSTASESPASSQKTAPNSKPEESAKDTSPFSAPAKKPAAPPASSKEAAPPASSEQTDTGKTESSVTTGNDFQTTQTYVLNTNTKKFHRSSCSDVKRIKPKNYATCNSRSEAIDSGYVPCKRCNP